MKRYKKESDYQSDLIKAIKSSIPNCTILKNDPNYIQGIPDLLVVYKDKYAFLEVKLSEDAPHQPNQDFYIDKFSRDSFAMFICPENEEQVLSLLYYYLLN